MLKYTNAKQRRVKNVCAICGKPVPRGHRKSKEPGSPVYCRAHAVWKRKTKLEVQNASDIRRF